ncbi:MAG: recombination regulator RecX [Coriobacteriia bacterium]|nr:recombination regulator RecX [Coriobacteriia bacterium]
MLVVTTIEPAGPDKRACRIFFGPDLPEGYVLPKAIVNELSIVEGSKFASPAELREKVDEAEPPAAMARCLRLLNARDKTTHELRARLSQDGYHGRAIDATLDRLLELSLVDDERFAENYVDTSLRAKKGWGRIVRELARKGIELDPDDEHYRPDPEDEYQAAFALVERLPVGTEKERNRVLRRLISRGYAYPTALKVLDARKMML